MRIRYCQLLCILSVLVMLLQVADPYIYRSVYGTTAHVHHALFGNADEEPLNLVESETRVCFVQFIDDHGQSGPFASALYTNTGSPFSILNVLAHCGPPLFIQQRNIRV